MPDTHTLDILSTDYPLLLKAIPNPPKCLYYKGSWNPEFFLRSVSVVGSRKMTMYGRQVVHKLLSELSGYNVTIVSGFMFGVDITAHEKSLALGIPTVAVVPFGIDYVCESSLGALYNSILNNKGLILSEWGDNLAPRKWTFAKRNRIVAGLSKLTLVIEAGLNSGSLLTAAFARSFNRVVAAVPGNIFSELSLGPLHLINTGAKPVVSGYDIARILNFDTHNYLTCITKPSQSSLIEEDSIIFSILAAIKNSPVSIDDLCTELNCSIALMSTKLTLLTLSGAVIEDNGRYFLPCL